MNEIRADYNKYLVLQLRAIDSHGAWKGLSDEELLQRAYLVPSAEEEKKPIPLMPEQFVRFQLQASAQILEQETGLIPFVVCETGCDGSVKAFVISGKIVIFQKVFYNTGDFRYRNIEKLFTKGEKVTEKILENYKSISEVTQSLF